MGTTDFKDRTILIAEDNDENFTLVHHTYKPTGVNIFRAKNGIEAVSLCRDHPEIELVLMDGMMPLMTGYDATREIRVFRPELPVVVITAYVNPASLQAAVAGGANDYLAKPIGVQELMSILKIWLPPRVKVN